MNRKLVAVTLITFLICGGLGSSIGCDGDGGGGGGGGGASYTLTIASTACGVVTTPGEGTFTYNASTVVNLVATPDAGCRFVNWTGDVGTIANVNAATTTSTMDGNYAITANFALGKLIAGVPDTSWPPAQTIPSTVSIDNYCAPLAMVNVLKYWDGRHGNAQGVTAGLPANETAEYIGYFMNTNDSGSRNRRSMAHNGTYAVDISPGTREFVRWDAGNPFDIPLPLPFPLPAGKIGYIWTMTEDYDGWGGNVTGFDFYKAEIDAGRPLVVCFRYWNPVYPVPEISVTDPATGETIDVFSWGNWASNSSYPEEEWDCPEYDPEHPESNPEYCIGHAVTGVGYILNWDPDGDDGPLPAANYTIVHDNWDTTPRNVAIPWDNWNSSHAVDPAGNPLVKYDLTISSAGLCGSVTTPGEGTFTCDVGAKVNLVATPGPVSPGQDCAFVNWTGDVGTVNNVSAASTFIIMNGNYNITANFDWIVVGPPVEP